MSAGKSLTVGPAAPTGKISVSPGSGWSFPIQFCGVTHELPLPPFHVRSAAADAEGDQRPIRMMPMTAAMRGRGFGRTFGQDIEQGRSHWEIGCMTFTKESHGHV